MSNLTAWESPGERPKRTAGPPERWIDQLLRKGARNLDVEQEYILIDDEDGTKRSVSDPMDADYEVSPSRDTLATNLRRRNNKPETWGHDELLRNYNNVVRERKLLQESHTKVWKGRTKSNKELAECKDICKRQEDEKKALSKTIDGLRAQLRDQYEKHNTESEQQREDFRKAEQDLIAKLESQKSYSFLPDNKIQNAFHDLWNKCRDWVRKWMEDLPIQCFMAHDSPYLGKYSCKSDPSLVVSLAEEFKPNQKLAWRIVGFAMLSRQIQATCLSSPFAFLADEARKTFEKTYSNFENINQREAYAWRAITIRCFRALHNIEPLEISGETVKSNYLHELCFTKAHAIYEFIEMAIAHPLPTLERDTMVLELKSICLNASLLAFELHCQKSKSEILASDQLFEVPFTISSELHHPVASMGLDDDDTSLDGTTPHTIVVPAICMWGNADGEHLGTRKILSKAHVYISKTVLKRLKEPEPSRLTPPGPFENQTEILEHKSHYQETEAETKLPAHRRDDAMTVGTKRRRLDHDITSKCKQYMHELQISDAGRSPTPENDSSPLGKPLSRTLLGKLVENIGKGNTHDRREQQRAGRKKTATSGLTAMDQRTLEEEKGENSSETQGTAQGNVGAPGVKEEKTSLRPREEWRGKKNGSTPQEINQQQQDSMIQRDGVSDGNLTTEASKDISPVDIKQEGDNE